MTVTLVVFLCVSPLALLVFFVFFSPFKSLETTCPSLWESEQRELDGEANHVCMCIAPSNRHEDHDVTVDCSPLGAFDHGGSRGKKVGERLISS